MAGQIPTKGAPGQRTSSPAKKAPTKVSKSKALALAKAGLADLADAPLPTDLTKAKAASLTKKIQTGIENTVELLHEAYQGRVWLALDHGSWDEYIEKEFGSAPLALPRSKRKPTVASLTERGWSSRAIAAATGDSPATIKRDVREAREAERGGSNEPPAPGIDRPVIDIPESDITEAPEGQEPPGTSDPEPQLGNQPQPPRTTGLDGKSYPARQPSPEATEAKDAVPYPISAAKRIATELSNLTVRLGALLDHDDYGEQQVAVREMLQQPIEDFALEATAVVPEVFSESVRSLSESIQSP